MKLILGIIVFLFISSNTIGGNVVDIECLKKYIEITEYNKNFESETFYLKIQTVTSINNKLGDTLTSEIWKSGNDIKYKNPYLTLYQQKNTQVIISKENKAIILKTILNPDSLLANLTLKQNQVGALDSLKKYTESNQCNIKGNFSSVAIHFNKNFIQKYLLKQIEIEYDETYKTTHSICFIYKMPNDQERKELYIYKTFTKKILSPVIVGSVYSTVFDKENKLKPDLKAFKLIDLRKK